jgi:hypothetical protein
MSYTPCRYARRWPQLWARLPDDRARQSLSDALANGRLEGVEPTRDDVELLVARACGELTDAEFAARALILAGQEAAHTAAS